MQGFIERQSEKYNATPGDTAYVIRAYNQKETQILATIAENFAFWDTYVCSTLQRVLILSAANVAPACGAPWTH